eukprot:2209063-Prymnesium_polylepis.3
MARARGVRVWTSSSRTLARKRLLSLKMRFFSLRRPLSLKPATGARSRLPVARTMSSMQLLVHMPSIEGFRGVGRALRTCSSKGRPASSVRPGMPYPVGKRRRSVSVRSSRPLSACSTSWWLGCTWPSRPPLRETPGTCQSATRRRQRSRWHEVGVSSPWASCLSSSHPHPRLRRPRLGPPRPSCSGACARLPRRQMAQAWPRAMAAREERA